MKTNSKFCFSWKRLIEEEKRPSCYLFCLYSSKLGAAERLEKRFYCCCSLALCFFPHEIWQKKIETKIKVVNSTAYKQPEGTRSRPSSFPVPALPTTENGNHNKKFMQLQFEPGPICCCDKNKTRKRNQGKFLSLHAQYIFIRCALNA